MKNIFILLLCFVLLYVAFHPSFLQKDESLFDEIDGSRKIVYRDLDGSIEYPLNSYDYVVDLEGVYVLDSDIYSLDSLSDNSRFYGTDHEYYKQVYDFVEHFYRNSDIYFDVSYDRNGSYEYAHVFDEDCAIEFFYSSYDPHSSILGTMHLECIGDFWIDTNFNRIKIYDGCCWQDIRYDLLEKYSDYQGYKKLLNVSFDDDAYGGIFNFGYELTIGTFEVVTSIFKGPDKFFERFSSWRTTLFGEVKLFDFITGWFTRSIDLLNDLADKLPVIGPLKGFIDNCLETLIGFIENVIGPLEDSFSNLVNWIRDKIG